MRLSTCATDELSGMVSYTLDKSSAAPAARMGGQQHLTKAKCHFFRDDDLTQVLHNENDVERCVSKTKSEPEAWRGLLLRRHACPALCPIASTGPATRPGATRAARCDRTLPPKPPRRCPRPRRRRRSTAATQCAPTSCPPPLLASPAPLCCSHHHRGPCLPGGGEAGGAAGGGRDLRPHRPHGACGGRAATGGGGGWRGEGRCWRVAARPRMLSHSQMQQQ